MFELAGKDYIFDMIGNKVRVGDIVIAVTPKKSRLIEAEVISVTFRGVYIKHTYWHKSVSYKKKQKAFSVWRGKGFFIKKIVEEDKR